METGQTGPELKEENMNKQKNPRPQIQQEKTALNDVYRSIRRQPQYRDMEKARKGPKGGKGGARYD